MEMVSIPSSSAEEEERKAFCRSSPPSRRPSRFLLCPPKLSWRDMGFLCSGLLSGLLLFHLLFGSLLPPSPQSTSSPRSTLDFFVIGDWGRRGLYNQSQVAIQMGRIGQRLSPRFVVSTGDNFYPTGLKGTHDPDFSSSFTNVYITPSLQVPWYAVLGNHDYMGDALAQFSTDLVNRDSRWFCRREFDRHYSLCQDNSSKILLCVEQLPSLMLKISANALLNSEPCKSSVDLFFIDTNTFVDEYFGPNTTHAFDWRGLAPRQNQLKSQLQVRRKWEDQIMPAIFFVSSSFLQDLVRKLAKSTAKWKLVIGHHTIRSVGHHGDTLELVNQLLPILERYSVDAYFNGHDHSLQHIKRPDSSVHFFTSGGGSKAFKGLRSYDDTAGVQFVYDGQGFLAVSMAEKSALFCFYDVFGNALYSFNLEKSGS